MFKLRFSKFVNNIIKGVLIHNTMTDNYFLIAGDNPDLKKLSYKALSILLGIYPGTEELDDDGRFQEYKKFLEDNGLKEYSEDNFFDELYQITDKEEGEPGWYVSDRDLKLEGIKVDVLGTINERF